MIKYLFFALIMSLSFNTKALETTQTDNANIGMFDIIDWPFVDSGDCLDWCIKGVCAWLKCSWFSCDVETSLRVSHRNPDLVFSSYRELGENPWNEARTIYSSLQKSVGKSAVSLFSDTSIVGGGNSNSTPGISSKESNNNTNFREADAIGYPINYSTISDEYFCGSQTTPLMIYYSSALDAYLWRLGVTEILYLPFILTDVIGYPYIKEWGSVYFRTGFTKQLNPSITNALIVQRVADIVTQPSQAHLYNPVSGTPSSGQRFFKLPNKINLRTDSGGVWKMVSPKKDNQCYIFNDVAKNPVKEESWLLNRSKTDEAGVYVLWRPYECCKQKGQWFLYSIPLNICL